VLGSLFLLVAFSDSDRLSGKHAILRLLLLGIIAGGMHLSRADGILWLAAALALVGWESINQYKHQVDKPTAQRLWLAGKTLLGLLVGYGLVMGSWYARNITLYGSLFSPGGAKTLWLTNYDQTFSYPASQLTWQAWAAQGLGTLVTHWWDALVWNLKNALAVQGGVFLFLLILPGLWALRKEKVVRFAMLMWLVTLAIMTFVFPFAGEQGGFLHSGSAIQPVLWAAVPFGLQAFVNLGVRLRHWNANKSWPVFAAGVAGLCVLFTLAIFWSRVVGSDPSQPVWSQSDRQYMAITLALQELGAGPEQRVLVNNPPGYNLASGGEALVIPDGDVATLLAVARRYGANYLVLEPNHVTGLNDLYKHPGSIPGLVYLKNIWGTVFIYRIPTGTN